MVLLDMNAENIYQFSEIRHVVCFAQGLLVLYDNVDVLAHKSKVINIESDNGYSTISIANKNGMVYLGVGVAHTLQLHFDIFVSNTASLLCAVNCLVEFEDHTFWGAEAGRRFHVDFFFEFPIQVGQFNVHMVDLQVQLGS
jgi:hypothetical protein